MKFLPITATLYLSNFKPKFLLLLIAASFMVACGSISPKKAEEKKENTGNKVPDQSWHGPCSKDKFDYKMIDVGEVKLNVGCRGSGPTVVFLHGFPEFHYSWKKVMDELSSEFRLVAPDQRGYNLSDKPKEIEEYSISKLTKDIVNLLPIISKDPVILVAHDWGGPIGWMVAHTPKAHIGGMVATNGPHPQRFSDLITNNEKQKAASSYMEFFRSKLADSYYTADKLADQFKGFLSKEELEVYKKAWSQPRAIISGLNWYRANKLDFDATKAIMKDMLPKVLVPSVVMWGEDDTAVLTLNADGLEPYVKDLKVRKFPGVDHWINHRIPKEIAQEIRELNKKISGK